MCVMSDEAPDTAISIRDLQRNAADVMTRVEHGERYVVTRHGRTVGRLLPPDPADEAINRAVADGILDVTALASARTAAQVARITPEPAAEAGQPSLSDALAELRADER
jgi:prevent-host-death family protein